MSLEHFGLHHQPFGVTPDPRFAFFGNAHREAIAALYSSILEGRGCALLVAQPGMGKTTLLNYLQARLGNSADVAVLSNFAPTRSGLLHEVMTLLGCEAVTDDTGENWRRLHAFLVERAQQGRKAVLVCDDAQSLSHDALEDIALMTRCELPQQKLIQIVIAGQPGLLPILRTPRLESLCQRIGIFSHLLPLPVDEVDAYIHHRLEVAGATREIFTREARAAVADFSKGIPLRINIIAHAALMHCWLAGRDLVEATIIDSIAAEMLDSVFPWQVSEEAAWSKFSVRRSFAAGPTAMVTPVQEGEDPAPNDIARRAERRGKKLVKLEQPEAVVPAIASESEVPARALAVHDVALHRPQATRNYEMLERLQRSSDLFGPVTVGTIATPSVPAVMTPQRAVLVEQIVPGSEPGWRALIDRIVSSPTTSRTMALSCIRAADSAALVLWSLGRAIAAMVDSPVLLVEASGKKSDLADLFDLEPKPGLDVYLTTPGADPAGFARATGIDNLFVITAGDDPTMVAERLSTPSGATAFGRLRAAFPLTLIELPSASQRHHALDVFAQVDDVVLIAKPGSSRVREAERIMHRLGAARIAVLGTILDDVELWGEESKIALPSLASLQRLQDLVTSYLDKVARRASRAPNQPHGDEAHPVVDRSHA